MLRSCNQSASRGVGGALRQILGEKKIDSLNVQIPGIPGINFSLVATCEALSTSDIEFTGGKAIGSGPVSKSLGRWQGGWACNSQLLNSSAR